MATRYVKRKKTRKTKRHVGGTKVQVCSCGHNDWTKRCSDELWKCGKCGTRIDMSRADIRKYC